MLALSDHAREDLALVQSASDEALRILGQGAMRLLKEEGREEVVASVDGVLKVGMEPIQRMVEVLAFIFTESAKLRFSETDFSDSLVSLQFRPSGVAVLKEIFLPAADSIRLRLRETSFRPPHYTDLEWRLDIELGSRTLHRQTNPVWLLKLHTSDSNGQSQAQTLQTDAVNLQHLLEELTMALSEQNAGYSRRVMRNIK